MLLKACHKTTTPTILYIYKQKTHKRKGKSLVAYLYVANGNVLTTDHTYILPKGTLVYETAPGLGGQRYGDYWDIRTRTWEKCMFCTENTSNCGTKDLAGHNRRYGSYYAHREGSRYPVERACSISHNSGTTSLDVGDWVAINVGQGWLDGRENTKIRVDGYYRNGVFRETYGGYLNMGLRQSVSSYQINTP